MYPSHLEITIRRMDLLQEGQIVQRLSMPLLCIHTTIFLRLLMLSSCRINLRISSLTILAMSLLLEPRHSIQELQSSEPSAVLPCWLGRVVLARQVAMQLPGARTHSANTVFSGQAKLGITPLANDGSHDRSKTDVLYVFRPSYLVNIQLMYRGNLHVR